MKRKYISPIVYCTEMEENLLRTNWSGANVENTQGSNESFDVNNNPFTPTDGGKSLGAKSDNFSLWDD